MQEAKGANLSKERLNRIKRLKKAIIAIVLTMMIVPTIICIVLVVKVISLQNEVDDLLALKDKSDGTVMQEESTIDVAGSESETDTGNKEDEQTTEPPNDDNQTPDGDELPEGKYAYLTFDDGPSSNTMEILTILEKYEVKATFFVNGHTGDKMVSRYKAIVDMGHKLGIHTYSHDYDKVYGGLDKFADEVISLREYLFNITGEDVTLFRFPGGSSNTIVDDIKPYIKWLHDNGYEYWDWNASSGDATGKPITAQEIVNLCVEYADRGYKELVILMHDTASKDSTVEALPALIEALQARGYEIITIDERSTPVQHR